MLKDLQVTVCVNKEMSEEVRIVSTGSRVERGDDWDGGNADGLVGGTGLGTIVRSPGNSGVVAVKWDSGNYGFYKMGSGGKYEVKIAVIGKTVYTGSEENEEEFGNNTDDEYESDEDENSKEEKNNIVLDTEQQCEVCGSFWTEKVREGENIIFRCIKHRKEKKQRNIS